MLIFPFLLWIVGKGGQKNGDMLIWILVCLSTN
jgi:hypothetical protein